MLLQCPGVVFRMVWLESPSQLPLRCGLLSLGVFKSCPLFSGVGYICGFKKAWGPEGIPGQSLSVGSRNLLVQRRSHPFTWTYDPRLRSHPAHRVPQDGLLPQAQATVHELPGSQRPAPIPSRPAGSTAELQLGLEQVTEAARCGVGGCKAADWLSFSCFCDLCFRRS